MVVESGGGGKALDACGGAREGDSCQKGWLKAFSVEFLAQIWWRGR